MTSAEERRLKGGGRQDCLPHFGQLRFCGAANPGCRRLSGGALAVVILTLTAFAQDFSEVKIELLGRGWGFTEGPAWSKEGYLIFSDTPGDRLLKWVPGQQI